MIQQGIMKETAAVLLRGNERSMWYSKEGPSQRIYKKFTTKWIGLTVTVR